jgi:hypothetical protein
MAMSSNASMMSRGNIPGGAPAGPPATCYVSRQACRAAIEARAGTSAWKRAPEGDAFLDGVGDPGFDREQETADAAGASATPT